MIKRYKMGTCTNRGDTVVHHNFSEDGEWVRWDDVKPLLVKLENALDKSREHEDIAYDVITERNELRTKLDAAMKVLSEMHDDGTICRDHYNPYRGKCGSHKWCKSLQALDELEGWKK
jgi:hypothetical protein